MKQHTLHSTSLGIMGTVVGSQNQEETGRPPHVIQNSASMHVASLCGEQVPRALPVVCGDKQGELDCHTFMVTCYCPGCQASHDGYAQMAASMFEQHGSKAAARKWKESIKLADGTGRTIARWWSQEGAAMGVVLPGKNTTSHAQPTSGTPSMPQSGALQPADTDNISMEQPEPTKLAAQYQDQGGQIPQEVPAINNTVDMARTVPRTLPVQCGDKHGDMDCLTFLVTCHCALCTASPAGNYAIPACAFEKHGGREATKKWKESIRLADGTGRTIARWWSQEGAALGVVLPGKNTASHAQTTALHFCHPNRTTPAPLLPSPRSRKKSVGAHTHHAVGNTSADRGVGSPGRVHATPGRSPSNNSNAATVLYAMEWDTIRTGAALWVLASLATRESLTAIELLCCYITHEWLNGVNTALQQIKQDQAVATAAATQPDLLTNNVALLGYQPVAVQSLQSHAGLHAPLQLSQHSGEENGLAPAACQEPGAATTESDPVDAAFLSQQAMLVQQLLTQLGNQGQHTHPHSQQQVPVQAVPCQTAQQPLQPVQTAFHEAVLPATCTLPANCDLRMHPWRLHGSPMFPCYREAAPAVNAGLTQQPSVSSTPAAQSAMQIHSPITASSLPAQQLTALLSDHIPGFTCLNSCDGEQTPMQSSLKGAVSQPAQNSAVPTAETLISNDSAAATQHPLPRHTPGPRMPVGVPFVLLTEYPPSLQPLPQTLDARPPAVQLPAKHWHSVTAQLDTPAEHPITLDCLLALSKYMAASKGTEHAAEQGAVPSMDTDTAAQNESEGHTGTGIIGQTYANLKDASRTAHETENALTVAMGHTCAAGAAATDGNLKAAHIQERQSMHKTVPSTPTISEPLESRGADHACWEVSCMLQSLTSVQLQNCIQRWLVGINTWLGDAGSHQLLTPMYRWLVHGYWPTAAGIVPKRMPPSGAYTQDVPPAKKLRKARVLKEGALSMIVYGYDEKLMWAKRVGTFIRSMRGVLGDRSLSIMWGGSVLDSVVGVFLTQNTSDVLSSTAFMTLAACFPSPQYKSGLAAAAARRCCQHSTWQAPFKSAAMTSNVQYDNQPGHVSTGVDVHIIGQADALSQQQPCSCVDDDTKCTAIGVDEHCRQQFKKGLMTGLQGLPIGTDIVDWGAVRRSDPERVSTAIQCRGMQFMLTKRIQSFLGKVAQVQKERSKAEARAAATELATISSTPKLELLPPQLHVATEVDASLAVMEAHVAEQHEGMHTVINTLPMGTATAHGNAMLAGFDMLHVHSPDLDVAVPSTGMTLSAVTLDGCQPANAHTNHHHQQQQQQPGPTHQPQNPVVTEQLSLEWLRDAPDKESAGFLMATGGLGEKSTGCVHLLSLGKKAFPVDTNVARVCARLGWIPLQSEHSLEELEQYPEEPEVHKYLSSRLAAFDLETLYELHYQMITLGKVFCAKRQPNCNSCPLAPECDYARCGGPRLGVPGPAVPRHRPQQVPPSVPSKQHSTTTNTTLVSSPQPVPVPQLESHSKALPIAARVMLQWGLKRPRTKYTPRHVPAPCQHQTDEQAEGVQQPVAFMSCTRGAPPLSSDMLKRSASTQWLALPHTLLNPPLPFSQDDVTKTMCALNELLAAKPAAVPYQQQPSPTADMEADGSKLWAFDRILCHRSRKQGRSHVTEYLVSWKGWPVESNSWIPADNFTYQQDIDKYWSSVPGGKPTSFLPNYTAYVDLQTGDSSIVYNRNSCAAIDTPTPNVSSPDRAPKSKLQHHCPPATPKSRIANYSTILMQAMQSRKAHHGHQGHLDDLPSSTAEPSGSTPENVVIPPSSSSALMASVANTGNALELSPARVAYCNQVEGLTHSRGGATASAAKPSGMQSEPAVECWITPIPVAKKPRTSRHGSVAAPCRSVDDMFVPATAPASIKHQSDGSQLNNLVTTGTKPASMHLHPSSPATGLQPVCPKQTIKNVKQQMSALLQGLAAGTTLQKGVLAEVKRGGKQDGMQGKANTISTVEGQQHDMCPTAGNTRLHNPRHTMPELETAAGHASVSPSDAVNPESMLTTTNQHVPSQHQYLTAPHAVVSSCSEQACEDIGVQKTEQQGVPLHPTTHRDKVLLHTTDNIPLHCVSPPVPGTPAMAYQQQPRVVSSPLSSPGFRTKRKADVSKPMCSARLLPTKLDFNHCMEPGSTQHQLQLTPPAGLSGVHDKDSSLSAQDMTGVDDVKQQLQHEGGTNAATTMFSIRGSNPVESKANEHQSVKADNIAVLPTPAHKTSNPDVHRSGGEGSNSSIYEYHDHAIAACKNETKETLGAEQQLQPNTSTGVHHVDRILNVLKMSHSLSCNQPGMELQAAAMPPHVALSILDWPEGTDTPSSSAVKSRYRELCFWVHPDKTTHAQAAAAFAALTQAFHAALRGCSKGGQNQAGGTAPQADEEVFWVDAETGNIRIPAYAKDARVASSDTKATTMEEDPVKGMKTQPVAGTCGSACNQLQPSICKEIVLSRWSKPCTQRSRFRTAADALVVSCSMMSSLAAAGLHIPDRLGDDQVPHMLVFVRPVKSATEMLTQPGTSAQAAVLAATSGWTLMSRAAVQAAWNKAGSNHHHHHHHHNNNNNPGLSHQQSSNHPSTTETLLKHTKLVDILLRSTQSDIPTGCDGHVRDDQALPSVHPTAHAVVTAEHITDVLTCLQPHVTATSQPDATQGNLESIAPAMDIPQHVMQDLQHAMQDPSHHPQALHHIQTMLSQSQLPPTEMFTILRHEMQQAQQDKQNTKKQQASKPAVLKAGHQCPPPADVYAVLLLPMRSALLGAFPLNATYFQTNEVFVDWMTATQPVPLPYSPDPSVAASAGQQSAGGVWRTVYFGLSTASIVRDMSLDQVASTFHLANIGVRCFDRLTGQPKPLPKYMTP